MDPPKSYTLDLKGWESIHGILHIYSSRVMFVVDSQIATHI